MKEIGAVQEVREVQEVEEMSAILVTVIVGRGFNRDICDLAFLGFRVCVATQFLYVATTIYCRAPVCFAQLLAANCSCHTDSLAPEVPVDS